MPSKYPSSNHPLVCSPQGKAAEENGFHYNNLRLVAADLFTAGSETTSTTLRWALLYMLLHPDIQSKSETYRSVAASLQDSFFRRETEHLSMDFAMRNSFGDCWSSRNQEKHFPNSCSGRGEAVIKRLELEGQVRSFLHFEGFTWGLAVVSAPSSSTWNRC